MCAHACVCEGLARCVSDHVLVSVWLCGCLFASLCASVVSTPRTFRAVTGMIVVYGFDISHLVPVVHQPLSARVRSFWFSLVSQVTLAVNMFWFLKCFEKWKGGAFVFTKHQLEWHSEPLLMSCLSPNLSVHTTCRNFSLMCACEISHADTFLYLCKEK